MNRRGFIITTAGALVAVRVGADPRAAEAQDLEFIAALERAQRERPARLAWAARIAPESEPGDPMVVHGQAVAEDGTAPVAGATVFAYHTDRDGHYDRPGSGPHSWRLRGWTLTDRAGRFEFQTIRPGPYPGRNTPAHIHLNIFVPGGGRYWDGLVFDDDPLLAPADRDAACRVRHAGGVQHVDVVFRLRAKNRF
jgi:protocatechuate 3,4-dioxygenase beta subunit